MAEQYFARRPFGYGRYGFLDRGRVVELLGAPNDEKLTRLGYLEKLDGRTATCECGECGSIFIGDAERAAHGRERHVRRELSPFEEDQRAERQEKMLNQIAPLYLDKTTASGGGTATEIRTETPTPATVTGAAPAVAPKKRGVRAQKRD